MCVAHVHKHTHNICGGCMEVYSSNVQIMQKPQWRELQFSLLFEKACFLSFVTHSVFLYGRFIYLIVDRCMILFKYYVTFLACRWQT